MREGYRNSLQVMRTSQPGTKRRGPDADRYTATRLTRWAARAGRHPPWRDGSVYQVAVAEILLQKTKAEDVEPVWVELVSRYPSAPHLASATLAKLRSIVGQLGLGRQRAERLRSMAKAMRDRKWYRMSVPGLGHYGTGVVRLTAHKQLSSTPVDGNIARIMSRYHGFDFERGEPRKKREVIEATAALLNARARPAGQLRVLYALVDLGAIVCTAAKPACPKCPLSEGCAFAAQTVS